MVRYLYAPLFFTLPPLLVASTKYWPWLDAVLTEHGTAKVIMGFWPVLYIVVNCIFQMIRPTDGVGTTQLMTLVAVIDQVIGEKIDRFGAKAKTILAENGPIDDGIIFREITQPRQQIRRLIDGLYLYMRQDIRDPHVKVKVVLAKMGTDHIDDYEVCVPQGEGPFAQPQELRSEYSGFSRTLKRRKILIVPDVAREGNSTKSKRCFVITSEQGQNNEGSMICYPVMHRDLGTPYVISVLVSEPGYFKVAHEDAWNLILDKFAKRIALEYGLQVLKERRNGG